MNINTIVNDPRSIQFDWGEEFKKELPQNHVQTSSLSEKVSKVTEVFSKEVAEVNVLTTASKNHKQKRISAFHVNDDRKIKKVKVTGDHNQVICDNLEKIDKMMANVEKFKKSMPCSNLETQVFPYLTPIRQGNIGSDVLARKGNHFYPSTSSNSSLNLKEIKNPRKLSNLKNSKINIPTKDQVETCIKGEPIDNQIETEGRTNVYENDKFVGYAVCEFLVMNP